MFEIFKDRVGFLSLDVLDEDEADAIEERADAYFMANTGTIFVYHEGKLHVMYDTAYHDEGILDQLIVVRDDIRALM